MMAAFAFVTLTCVGLVNAANAPLRLIMVEETGCRFCQRWDTDVGTAYPRTREGSFAPLLRVKRGAPELKTLAPVVYTPTFILVRGQNEIGRITGYPGRHYFWEELVALIEQAGFTGNSTGGMEPANFRPASQPESETLVR
jgi:hypothetical protein